MSRQRYYFSIDDFASARGRDPQLAFSGRSPQALAEAVQEALRRPDLFECWRRKQEDPERVDAALAALDPQAQATAGQADLRVELEVVTELPMRVLRQRLEWLIGTSWRLHDVRAARAG